METSTTYAFLLHPIILTKGRKVWQGKKCVVLTILAFSRNQVLMIHQEENWAGVGRPKHIASSPEQEHLIPIGKGVNELEYEFQPIS